MSNENEKLNQFAMKCLKFLQDGRTAGMFNAGIVNANAVMGCAIQYAYGRPECDNERFEDVYEQCSWATQQFLNWVEEGN